MSHHAVEIRSRATRVRSLGDATPIYRAGESRAGKTAGEKTNGEIDKTMTERLADLRDAAEMTTSCAIDGCTWSHSGPAGAARTVALAHRQHAHPGIEKGVRRCTTPGCTGRAVRGLDTCSRCHNADRRERATTAAMRARGLNRDGTTLLEEAGPAPVSAGGDGSPASSSSQLDPLVEIDPEPTSGPSADLARAAGPATDAAAPTGTRPSGEISASTPNQEGKPMRRSWTRDSLIDELQKAYLDLSHTPTAADLKQRGLASMLTKAFLKIHGFESYVDLCRAAGLEPNLVGRNNPPAAPAQPPVLAISTIIRVPPEVATPAPVDEPEVREPIRNADIPYDADVLEREAAFLRRRADAFEIIAGGVRAIAEIDGERAA